MPGGKGDGEPGVAIVNAEALECVLAAITCCNKAASVCCAAGCDVTTALFDDAAMICGAEAFMDWA